MFRSLNNSEGRCNCFIYPRRHALRFQGHANVEELSDLLKDESDRCVVIDAAAFFDETLARLLGDTTDRSLNAKINDARDYGILTQNEHDDLHKVRNLRNRFAHNLRAAEFDANVCGVVGSMATWNVASSELPRYEWALITPLPRCPDLWVAQNSRPEV